tara:strand:- start:206 stop:508 length:303 start_codon:yes stop_codon:yes gene_type:complete
MKKKNEYICHTCKEVNPKVVVSELWDGCEDGPFKIEVLILIKTTDLYYYDSENIILRKKLSKKTIKLHTCGKCHMPLKEIYNKRHLKIIKEIEKLEKKLK